MNITVKCIHRSKDLTRSIASNTACNTDNNMTDHNKVTCRINSMLSDVRFHLPEDSIILNDIMNFSNDMNIYQQYDCVLEIASFNQVELFTNHRCSIRGKYWKNVPQKYLPRYYIYKEQECIEIGNDIILISIYSNGFTNKVNDGGIIEMISQGSINLRSVNKHIL